MASKHMGGARHSGAGVSVREQPLFRVEGHLDSAVLGAERSVSLGYADSGEGPVLYPDPADRQRFVRADVSEAASRLAAVLDDVGADALVYYDAAGGNHHPDHMRCHQVATAASRLRPTEILLETTIPRELLEWSRRTLGWLPQYPYTAEQVAGGGTPRAHIDVRANVTRFIPRKLEALFQHRSVITNNSKTSGLAKLLGQCPPRFLSPLLGREWYRTIRGDSRSVFTEARLAV